MELFGTCDLMQFVQKKGTLEEVTARKVFRQLADAVYMLHELGIVHGNLRDENVLIDPESLTVKLCHFSQEHAISDDILALGIVLFSLVMGARPFLSTRCVYW